MEHEPAPQYVEFTKEKYNKTIERQHNRRIPRLMTVVGAEAASLLAFYGFVEAHPIKNAVDSSLLSIPWILPVPLLILTTYGAYKYGKDREKSVISDEVYDNKDKKVVFTVTSQGNNVKTIKNSMDSVYYWYNKLEEDGKINYECIINAVIEPDAYAKHKEFYDHFSKEYTKTRFILTVVPKEYETSNGTKYKARALNYSVEERRRQGLTHNDVWAYHQDEETTVGEDTLLGISEFIHKAPEKTKYGAGFIIYCLDWTMRPSQIQEMSRTNDDYRVLLSLCTKKNPMVGFHGSHFIIRSTAEEETGWNIGGKALAEDLIFENSLRSKNPDSFSFLKGFAYEKAANDAKGQIKQRRRWALGIVDAFKNKGISVSKRAAMVYNSAAWFGSLASVAATFIPLLPIGFYFYPISLSFTGYIWSQMIIGYYDGYLFHKEYIPKEELPYTHMTVKMVSRGVVGALTDAIAPWYALKRSNNKSGGFEVLDKDACIKSKKMA